MPRMQTTRRSSARERCTCIEVGVRHEDGAVPAVVHEQAAGRDGAGAPGHRPLEIVDVAGTAVCDDWDVDGCAHGSYEVEVEALPGALPLDGRQQELAGTEPLE